jgi:hypothetical protein
MFCGACKKRQCFQQGSHCSKAGGACCWAAGGNYARNATDEKTEPTKLGGCDRLMQQQLDKIKGKL